MHKCYLCGLFKPESEFYKNKNRSKGLSNRCIPCDKISRSKYNEQSAINYRKKYAAQRAAFLANKKRRQYHQKLIQRYKSFVGCKICKKRYHFCQLEFLQKDLKLSRKQNKANKEIKNKIKSPAQAMGSKTLRKSIRDHDVVCANCHKLIISGFAKKSAT